VEKLILALIAQQAEGGAGNGQQGGWQQMLNMGFFIVVIFVIIFFLIIRPQQKQQKKHKEMLAALKKGDRVLTSSGIFGTITNMTDTVVTLEISKSIHIRLLRSQIAGPAPAEKTEDSGFVETK
jgi:preprotein translocase subunit YajC